MGTREALIKFTKLPGKTVIREKQNRSFIWSNNGQPSVRKPVKDVVEFPPKDEALINHFFRQPAVLSVYNLGGWNTARLSFHDRSASLCIMKPDQRGSQSGSRKAADVTLATCSGPSQL